MEYDGLTVDVNVVGLPEFERACDQLRDDLEAWVESACARITEHRDLAIADIRRERAKGADHGKIRTET